MNSLAAPRPHHLSAELIDTLPCDVAVERAGGLIDLYLDVDEPVWQRIRLDTGNALKLYRALAHRISSLPVRLENAQ